MELKNLPRNHPAHLYKSYWDAFSTEETIPNIILYHGRILVPNSAQAETLRTLHMNHCGLAKSLANARQLYFWCGMAKDIKNDIEKCQECLKMKLSKHLEPLVLSLIHI